MTRQPKVLQRSFAGGEVSPKMFGRVDDAKTLNGAAKMRNMEATPQGAASRRPGTQYVAKTKDGEREQLFEFRYSLGQSLVVSGGRTTVDGRKIGHFRFHVDGGTLLYEQPEAHIVQVAPSTHISGLWTTGAAHGFATGQPVAVTMAATAASPSVTFPSVATADDQTFTYTGANLDFFGQQVMFDEDGGTLPPNVEPRRLYWVTLKSGTTYTFSETYQGPNVKGAGVASTATIRMAAMPSNPSIRYRANVVYYVIEVSATTFRIAVSRNDAIAGNAITTSAHGDGTWNVHPAYLPGDLVAWSGVGPGNFYCIRAPWCSAPEPIAFDFCHTNDHLGHPPTSTTHWVRIPGEFNATPTLNAGTNTVDWGSIHGFADGDPILFAGTMPAGLNPSRTYFLRNASGTTFQVSDTPQGAPIEWTGVGVGVTALVGSVYEVPHYYTIEHLLEITTSQSFDVLTMASPDHPASELRRLSASRWEFAAIRFGSTTTPPDKPFLVEADGGEAVVITNIDAATPRVFTTVSNHQLSAGDPVYIQGCDGQGVLDGFYIIETPTAATTFTVKTVESGNVLAGGTAGIPAAGRVRLSEVSAEVDNAYVVTAIDDDGQESGASLELEVTNNLFVAGAKTVIGWVASARAQRYRVYKRVSGLYGLIGETPDLQFTDDNIGPDLSVAPPIPDDSLRRTKFVTFDTANDLVNWPGHGFPAGTSVRFFTNGSMPVVEGQAYYVKEPSEDAFQLSDFPDLSNTVNVTGTDNGEHWGEGGNFPSAVTYFEGRRAFAGSRPQPQDVWMTASGTESDLSYSLPTVDSDRIYFRIASREVAVIEHLVPLSQLLVLSDAIEFRLTPINVDAVTPTSISIRPQSYIGSGSPQPSLVNNIVVFAAARGGHLRELGYNRDSLGYLTGDLSLRAEHLFESQTILDQAYAKAPTPTIWVVSSSGKLLGLTYIPEEQVGAWHQHDTPGGVFRSVAAIPEGDDDAVYVVTERSGLHYIERMAPRFAGDAANAADAFFVDLGTTYQGPAVTQVTGMPWLEGQAVAFLADGIAGTGKVVNGALSLPKAASVVHVGLSYVSELETVPAFLQVDAFGSAHQKNVNSVTLRVSQSGAAEIVHSDKRAVPTRDPVAGQLKTGVIEPVNVPGSWGIDDRVVVRQASPLPLTVVSMTIEYTLGGG